MLSICRYCYRVMPVYLFLIFCGPPLCLLTASRTHQRVCHSWVNRYTSIAIGMMAHLPARSFLSQCSRMNGGREGILVHWPAESPIWLSGSSLTHVECEWHSNLRDLETNYTGCSTTSVRGLKTFSSYQNRTFSSGYNVGFVCGRSHVRININPGTSFPSFPV
jgi:hypothetical protein